MQTGRDDNLEKSAERVAELLFASGTSLVLAESCTAGLVSAALGGVPGISTVLCGSAVVYQIPTKTAWLEIPPDLIAAHDAVSEFVALAMADGVLEKTPYARVAASITGHLGPNADPPELDGVVWMCCRERNGRGATRRLRLPEERDADSRTADQRRRRQRLAATALLDFIADFLNQAAHVPE